MSDIVERLRERATNGDGWTRPVAADALAEIERLRAVLRRALHLHDIEQAERSAPNVPAWVEDARALLEDKP